MMKQNQATVMGLALVEACLFLYVHECRSRQMVCASDRWECSICLLAGRVAMNVEADKVSALPTLTAQSRAAFPSNVAKNAADSSSWPARPCV